MKESVRERESERRRKTAWIRREREIIGDQEREIIGVKVREKQGQSV